MDQLLKQEKIILIGAQAKGMQSPLILIYCM